MPSLSITSTLTFYTQPKPFKDTATRPNITFRVERGLYNNDHGINRSKNACCHAGA